MSWVNIDMNLCVNNIIPYVGLGWRSHGGSVGIIYKNDGKGKWFCQFEDGHQTYFTQSKIPHGQGSFHNSAEIFVMGVGETIDLGIIKSAHQVGLKLTNPPTTGFLVSNNCWLPHIAPDPENKIYENSLVVITPSSGGVKVSLNNGNPPLAPIYTMDNSDIKTPTYCSCGGPTKWVIFTSFKYKVCNNCKLEAV